MRLSSRVQTLRAHTLISLASGVPSFKVRSVASHQHLRCEVKRTTVSNLETEAPAVPGKGTVPSGKGNRLTAGFRQKSRSFWAVASC